MDRGDADVYTVTSTRAERPFTWVKTQFEICPGFAEKLRGAIRSPKILSPEHPS